MGRIQVFRTYLLQLRSIKRVQLFLCNTVGGVGEGYGDVVEEEVVDVVIKCDVI